MIRFHSVKIIMTVLVLSAAWLVTACTAQVPISPGEDTIPHFDELVNAVSSGSTEQLLELVEFSSLPCTKEEGLGGAPKCLAEEAEGTLVEVLPILGPEGHHIRRSEINTWPGISGAQLYAAFRTPEDTYSDEFFPAGDYGVAFLLPDKINVAVFQLTDRGIVRIDYHTLSSFQEMLKSSEVIVGPIELNS